MPALADRLSDPLPAMFMYISDCSADEIPWASICAFWITVTGSAASISVRLMREPVTLMRSSVRVASLAVSAGAVSWAAAVPASASAMANESAAAGAVMVRLWTADIGSPEIEQWHARCGPGPAGGFCRCLSPLTFCLTCVQETCQFRMGSGHRQVEAAASDHQATRASRTSSDRAVPKKGSSPNRGELDAIGKQRHVRASD